MPGCFRHSLPSMLKEVAEAVSYGIVSFILFPKVEEHLKSNYAEEAYNPNGLVPRAIQAIKQAFPHVVVCTDIALDPYSSVVRESWVVLIYPCIIHYYIPYLV